MACDHELINHPKFRHFHDECAAVLLQFEYSQEWADVIRHLLRLQKTLNKYVQLPIIPDRVLVAKRLYQCLNPALPSGVHEKTLETLELIFSRIGPCRLACDLSFYSEGIFPLYKHGTYQVKSKLLCLFERYYVPLGSRVVPCLSGLVFSLLSAMEDVGSEHYQRAIKMLDTLTQSTPLHAIMSAIWGRLLHNPSVRYQSLTYLTMRFPQARRPAPAEAAPSAQSTTRSLPTLSRDPKRLDVSRAEFCPDAQGCVMHALMVALQHGDTLVRRAALDLLVTHFPLPSSSNCQGGSSTDSEGDAAGRLDRSPFSKHDSSDASGRDPGRDGTNSVGLQNNVDWNEFDLLFSTSQCMLLLATALSLLPLREWSLTRRVYLWLIGAPTAAGLPLPQHADELFVGACRILLSPRHSAVLKQSVPLHRGGETISGPVLTTTMGSAPLPPNQLLSSRPRAAQHPFSSEADHDGSLQPFSTLAQALEVPSLSTAFAANDSLLLAALRRRLMDVASLKMSELSYAELLFERLPLPALWRALEALLSHQIFDDGRMELSSKRTSTEQTVASSYAVGLHSASDALVLVDRAMPLLLGMSCNHGWQTERFEDVDLVVMQLLQVGKRTCQIALSVIQEAVSEYNSIFAPSQCTSVSGVAGAHEVKLENHWFLLRHALHLFSNIAYLISRHVCARVQQLHSTAPVESRSCSLETLPLAAKLSASSSATHLSDSRATDPAAAIREEQTPVELPPSIMHPRTQSRRGVAAPIRARAPTPTPAPSGPEVEKLHSTSKSVQSLSVASDTSGSCGSGVARASPAKMARELRSAYRRLCDAFLPVLGSLVDCCRSISTRHAAHMLPLSEMRLACSVLSSLLTSEAPIVALPLPVPLEITSAAFFNAGFAQLSYTVPGQVPFIGATATGGCNAQLTRSYLQSAGGLSVSIRARPPFPELMRMNASFSALAAPPVSWHVDDDLEFCQMTGCACAFPPHVPDVSAAERRQVCNELGLRRWMAWAKVLIDGSAGCAHFEVVSCCALTLAHIISCRLTHHTGIGDACCDDPPMSDSEVTSHDASSIFRAVWGFLSYSDARTQHTAASVWIALLRVWNDVGAAVICSELRNARSDSALTTCIRCFSMLWHAAVNARLSRLPIATGAATASDSTTTSTTTEAHRQDLSVAPPLPGVGMLLVLDALRHPSGSVRAAAQQWVTGTPRTAHALLLPLLALLISSPSSCCRVRRYALEKLQLALHCMPAGTLTLLSQQLAPDNLVWLCRQAVDKAAPSGMSFSSPRGIFSDRLRSSCSLLDLLTASTLVVVLHPLVRPQPGPSCPDHRVGENATCAMQEMLAAESEQRLASELLTALLHSVTPELKEEFATLLIDPLLVGIQTSMGIGSHSGVRSSVLPLAFVTLSLSQRAAATDEMLVQIVVLGLSSPSSADWTHWVDFAVASLPLSVTLPSPNNFSASLVTIVLTTLSDLLASSPLSLPQLEALLVALHHTHHFCLFACLPVPIPTFVLPVPLQSQAPPIMLAQHALVKQLPVVLSALVRVWYTFGPADIGLRQLILSPLALLAQHSQKELLSAFVIVWWTEREGFERDLAENPVRRCLSARVAGRLDGAVSETLSSEVSREETSSSRNLAIPSQPGTALARTSIKAALDEKLGSDAAATDEVSKDFRDAYFSMWEEVVLGVLSELPACSPLVVIPAVAEIALLQRNVDTAQAGLTEIDVLGFLLLYIRHAQPVASLAASWPMLRPLLRSRNGCRGAPISSLLLLILCEWVRRVESLGESSPLELAKERHEAIDACEFLLKGAAKVIERTTLTERSTLQRLKREALACRPPARMGADSTGAAGVINSMTGATEGSRRASFARYCGALRCVEPYFSSLEGNEVGIHVLLSLEKDMMKLLTSLYQRDSPRQHSHAIGLLTSLLPVLLAPIELAITAAEVTATTLSGPAVPAGYRSTQRIDRLAYPSMLLLLRIMADPSTSRAWRPQVAKLFGLPGFFTHLKHSSLSLWSRIVNDWLSLETPKASVALLMAGKMGKTTSWFASTEVEVEAHVDQLRRISFAAWAGEHNQYVGALQGMLIDRVVAGFKYGSSSECASPVRWRVQVEAVLCVRVLAVRIAAEHLTSLWPIAMAELQRVFLDPEAAHPQLLLTACQLVDMLLAVLPEDFLSLFGWMFVPSEASYRRDAGAPVRTPLAREGAQLSDGHAWIGDGPKTFDTALRTESSMRHHECDTSCSPGFASLLEPLAELGRPYDNAPMTDQLCGLFCQSITGRRRPLLGIVSVQHASELAPFASQLHKHLSDSALLPRAAEIDRPFLDLLIGCQFLSVGEAAAILAPHLQCGGGA